MTFNTWAEYKAYLKSLPTDKDRIDDLFGTRIRLID